MDNASADPFFVPGDIAAPAQETQRDGDWFRRYIEQTPPRSTTSLARDLGVHPVTVRRVAARNNWRARAASYDGHVSALRATTAEDTAATAMANSGTLLDEIHKTIAWRLRNVRASDVPVPALPRMLRSLVECAALLDEYAARQRAQASESYALADAVNANHPDTALSSGVTPDAVTDLNGQLLDLLAEQTEKAGASDLSVTDVSSSLLAGIRTVRDADAWDHARTRYDGNTNAEGVAA